jgi:hypothetical protein
MGGECSTHERSSYRISGKNSMEEIKLSLCFSWASRHEGVLVSGGITPLIL